MRVDGPVRYIAIPNFRQHGSPSSMSCSPHIPIEALFRSDRRRHDLMIQTLPFRDRKSVVSGKSVSVRVGLGGRRIFIKKRKRHTIKISKTKKTSTTMKRK